MGMERNGMGSMRKECEESGRNGMFLELVRDGMERKILFRETQKIGRNGKNGIEWDGMRLLLNE